MFPGFFSVFSGTLVTLYYPLFTPVFLGSVVKIVVESVVVYTVSVGVKSVINTAYNKPIYYSI